MSQHMNRANQAPLLKESTLSSVNRLKQMASTEGLAFILSNSNIGTHETAPYTNSGHAYSNFINGLGWAQAINASDIRTVAEVVGDKFLKTDTYPGFYVAGDRPALNEVNRSCFLDYSGTLWVVMGNWGNNVSGREHLYNAINFKGGLPNSAIKGWQTTPDGWVVASVAQVHQGTDDLSKNYMHVTTVEDAYDSQYELKYENQVNQATRKCGGKSKWTGTCCLYYKDNYYDAVADRTFDAGDFYKCTCAKCYHCLELAKALDMHHVFTSYTGTGPTGGDGTRCLSCDEDNFPTNCGPCACKIESLTNYDRILSDIHLPTNGIAKQNALIAKRWTEELTGSAFCSLEGSFENLNRNDKTVSETFWGKSKEFQLPGILLNESAKPTIIEIRTSGNKGSEIVEGINVKQVGQYMSIPSVPIGYIKNIWPNAKEEYFRVTRIGNAHKDIELITGQLLPMIKKRIMFADVFADTDISKFDGYGIASLYEVGGRPFFPSSTSTKQTARLTYRNIMSTTSTDSDEAAKSKQTKKSNWTATNEQNSSSSASGASATDAVKIANIKTINNNLSTRSVEFYVGNDVVNDGLIITDEDGARWTTTSSIAPTSKTTNEILSPQNTKVILTNNESITIPTSVSKVTTGQVLSSASLTVEIIIGQAEKQY